MLSILEKICEEVMRLEAAAPFLTPVSTKLVKDYARIVSRPMDLRTIKKKLTQQEYVTKDEFKADVKQIVINSTLYNGENVRGGA